MAKIVSINNRIVSVGYDDGRLEDFDIANFNFEPRVGDVVEIYRNDSNIVINRKGCNKKVVNKYVYFVLAVLLGGFGINEFYAGNYSYGIVSVCFCWTFIPHIVNFIKGIIVLMKKDDGSGYVEL